MKNYIFGLLIVLLMVGSVAASVAPKDDDWNNDCHSGCTIAKLNVQAVDSLGNNLTGVTAAPEWKGLWFGWNDFFPKSSTTGSNGMTSHTWVVLPKTTVQVNYASLDGYTCTSGKDTRITAKCGLNTLTTVCTKNPDNDVPEFGVIAAGVALMGAIAGIIVFRRN